VSGTAVSLCVDASVGVKWFLQCEEDSGLALCLLERFVEGQLGLVVPELFYYEMGNALCLAVRRGRVRAETALAALDQLGRLSLGIVGLHGRLGSIFAFSQRLGISFYDAVYLAAAEASGSRLVTCDKRLLQGTGCSLDWVIPLDAAIPVL